MRPALRVKLALAAAIVLAAACHDTPTQPRAQSPLVGQWMLTTHMDTFVFATGPSYSDGPCPGPYCVHRRTTVDSAYLGGLLQVRDSLGGQGIVATSVQAAGTLTQRFCDSIDYDWDTGCLHVSDRVYASYIGEISGTPDSTTRPLHIDLFVYDPTTAGGRELYSLDATYAGDSIYGRFYWGMPGHSSLYDGSFVLRRVK